MGHPHPAPSPRPPQKLLIRHQDEVAAAGSAGRAGCWDAVQTDHRKVLAAMTPELGAESSGRAAAVYIPRSR